jgi:hypothetical protein
LSTTRTSSPGRAGIGKPRGPDTPASGPAPQSRRRNDHDHRPPQPSKFTILLKLASIKRCRPWQRHHNDEPHPCEDELLAQEPDATEYAALHGRADGHDGSPDPDSDWASAVIATAADAVSRRITAMDDERLRPGHFTLTTRTGLSYTKTPDPYPT